MILFRAALVLLFALLGAPAHAAQLQAPCTQLTQTASECDPVNVNNPMPVTLNQTGVADPCAVPGIAKSSASISVTSATTTSLVAVSGSTTVYVCGFVLTIAPSGTSADTAQFEYGTGAACTSPTVLTGTFGNGDLTTTTGVAPISYGGAGQTVFKSAASAGICIVSAGTTVNIQGVMTYVQQ